jgi:YD repeat-containing protein
MTVAGQPAVTYAYDNANRLLTITQGNNVVTIIYDAAGQRTSVSLPNGVVTEYTYDAASRVTGLAYRKDTTTLGTLSYTYDAAGNRVGVGGTWARTALPPALDSASYDAANRHLTFGAQVLAYDLNGNLLSDGTSGYTWDARNRLTASRGPPP